MILKLTGKEIQAIEKEVKAIIAQTFFPKNYDSTDDLKNYSPTDLTRDRDGNRITGKFLSSDISIGAPSPGMWGFFLPISIASTILLAMAIAAIGYFAFVPFAEGYHTLLESRGMVREAVLSVLLNITFYFVVINAILAVPTFAVITLLYYAQSEQEISNEYARIFWVVAFSFMAILILPGSGIVLALIAGTHGAIKQFISGRWLVGILVAISPILGAIVAIAVALIGLYYFRLFFWLVSRSRQQGIEATLDQQRTDSMRDDIKILESARKEQAAASLRDQTPLFVYGKSRYVLRKDGDPLTPDGGAFIGQSAADLSTHLFVSGRSGVGKTMCALKPTIFQWRHYEWGGVFACDPGKSELPHDCADLLDHVITPETHKINMLKGVDPEVASSILFKAYSSSSEGKIFDTSAEQDIRMALFVLDYVAKNEPWMAGVAPYSIRSLYRFISDEMYRMGIIGNIPAPSPDYLQIAWHHWEHVVPNMPKETQGSVEFTVRAWLADFVLHHLLENWADEASDLNIAEYVATGGAVGVECSPAKYGAGGEMALTLIKEAVYGRIKRRSGKNWKSIPTEKPLLFMMDECADGLTMSDVQMIRIARSLGCTMVFAVQEYESIVTKLSESSSTPNDATEAFLNQFSSRITFQGTEKMLESSCRHAGQRSRWLPDQNAVYSSPLQQTIGADLADGNADWNKGHIKNMLEAFTGIFTSAKRALSIDLRSKNDEENLLINKGAVKGEIKMRDTITPEELSPHFERSQTALVVLRRAGATRREVCDMSMWLPRGKETFADACQRVLASAGEKRRPPQLLLDDKSSSSSDSSSGSLLLEHKNGIQRIVVGGTPASQSVSIELQSSGQILTDVYRNFDDAMTAILSASLMLMQEEELACTIYSNGKACSPKRYSLSKQNTEIASGDFASEAFSENFLANNCPELEVRID